jgi:hypothetical protein
MKMHRPIESVKIRAGRIDFPLRQVEFQRIAPRGTQIFEADRALNVLRWAFITEVLIRRFFAPIDTEKKTRFPNRLYPNTVLVHDVAQTPNS